MLAAKNATPHPLATGVVDLMVHATLKEVFMDV